MFRQLFVSHFKLLFLPYFEETESNYYLKVKRKDNLLVNLPHFKKKKRYQTKQIVNLLQFLSKSVCFIQKQNQNTRRQENSPKPQWFSSTCKYLNNLFWILISKYEWTSNKFSIILHFNKKKKWMDGNFLSLNLVMRILIFLASPSIFSNWIQYLRCNGI